MFTCLYPLIYPPLYTLPISTNHNHQITTSNHNITLNPTETNCSPNCRIRSGQNRGTSTRNPADGLFHGQSGSFAAIKQPLCCPLPGLSSEENGLPRFPEAYDPTQGKKLVCTCGTACLTCKLSYRSVSICFGPSPSNSPQPTFFRPHGTAICF